MDAVIEESRVSYARGHVWAITLECRRSSRCASLTRGVVGCPVSGEFRPYVHFPPLLFDLLLLVIFARSWPYTTRAAAPVCLIVAVGIICLFVAVYHESCRPCSVCCGVVGVLNLSMVLHL